MGESPIKAHILLNEFSSGNQAKRGRSTVEGRLIFEDEAGELVNVRIRVRGKRMWSAWKGADTQRRQATDAFDRKPIEEIARLK